MPKAKTNECLNDLNDCLKDENRTKTSLLRARQFSIEIEKLL